MTAERSEPFADLAALEAWLAEMAAIPSDEGLDMTEIDHGLQCACELKLAAPDDVELQVAGLVHDVDHGRVHIRDHAWSGAEAVRHILGDRIAELVGLHVEAKRWLVTHEPAYRARLSPVSLQTLALQGGDFTAAESAAFEAFPHWRAALDLRRADDRAKTPGRQVPGLETWLPALREAAARQAARETSPA